MVMVKPGLPYLDVLARVKDAFGVPTFAYPGVGRICDDRGRRGGRGRRPRRADPRDFDRVQARRGDRRADLSRAGRRPPDQWLRSSPRPSGCACATGAKATRDCVLRDHEHAAGDALARRRAEPRPMARRLRAHRRLTSATSATPSGSSSASRRRTARLLRAQAGQLRPARPSRAISKSAGAFAKIAWGQGYRQGSGDRQPRPRLRALRSAARRRADGCRTIAASWGLMERLGMRRAARPRFHRSALRAGTQPDASSTGSTPPNGPPRRRLAAQRAPAAQSAIVAPGAR